MRVMHRDSKVSLRREQCGAHPGGDAGIGGESGPRERQQDVAARVADPLHRHHK